MSFALLGCIFLFTVLALNQLLSLFTRKQRLLLSRLEQSLSDLPKGKVVRTHLHRTRRLGQWADKLYTPGSAFGKQLMGKIQSDLVKAGIPLKAQEMVIIALFTALICLGAGLLLWGIALAGLIFGVAGSLVPFAWVSLLKKRRHAKLEGQLLDVVVMLANSLRAGHSFLQAMELVARETPPPLGDEFHKVVRETRLGVAVEEALENLGERVDSKDVELLVTGVLIQRQVGGNLAEILDTIADTIDKRIKMKAKIQALTAQGRMTAWIISLLPFGLGAFVFGKYPEFFHIMLVEPVGKIMLVSGVIMLAVGILVVRKVVAIDV